MTLSLSCDACETCYTVRDTSETQLTRLEGTINVITMQRLLTRQVETLGVLTRFGGIYFKNTRIGRVAIRIASAPHKLDHRLAVFLDAPNQQKNSAHRPAFRARGVS